MKHIIAPFFIASLLVSSFVQAVPVTKRTPAMSLSLPQKNDKQPGDLVQCIELLPLGGEHEVGDQIFIGTERVGASCVLPYGLVPMASNRNGGNLISSYKSDTRVLHVRLNGSGDSVWMSKCFIPEKDGMVLKAAPPAMAEFIIDRNLLHFRCKGRAQIGTLNRYDFEVKIDRAIDPEERVILGQWLAIPDLMRHKLNGRVHQGVWLREGTDYTSKVQEGAQFDQGDLVPLTLEVKDGFLALIARSDSDDLSDGRQCDIVSLVSAPVGYVEQCDTDSKAILIYKTEIDTVFAPGEWVRFGINARWGKYRGAVSVGGALDFSINGENVRQWSGSLGRDDQLGPFMTLGGFYQGNGDKLQISFRNVSVKHNLPEYDVNLLRNPNNYGVFSDTWKVIKGQRSQGRGYAPFFHNRMRWAGWHDGFFGTPYYDVTRMQEIDLGPELAGKYNWSRNPPVIEVGEQFNKTYCGGDSYHLSVEVYDADRNRIDQDSTASGKVQGECSWKESPWTTVKFTVNYEGIPRYIRFIDGGEDKEFWRGYFGPRIREGFVILRKR